MTFIESRTAKIDGMTFARMFADTPEELDAMALRVGLDLAWKKQADTPIAHFLVTMGRRDMAVRNGAVVLDTDAVIARVKAREAGDDALAAVRNSAEWAQVAQAAAEIASVTEAIAASESTVGYEAAATNWVLAVRRIVARVSKPTGRRRAAVHPPASSPGTPGSMW